MKRLGENVFHFKLSWSNPWMDFCWSLVPLGVGAFLFFVQYRKLGMLFIIFGIIFPMIALRYFKSGVILDKEKGIITLHKWTWLIFRPQKFEEIQISEIMGTEQDVYTSTKTELIGNKWTTTESKTYNIVLQGKFGSRRFSLGSRDDWNLFMTLLYGEE